jgi:hypothetical protein
MMVSLQRNGSDIIDKMILYIREELGMVYSLSMLKLQHVTKSSTY